MWRRSATPASSQTWENSWPTSTHSTVKPSITLTQVGYRKDSRMHNSKAIMAFLMLLSKLQQSQKAKPESSNQNNSSAERGLRTLRQACYQENPGSAMCVQNFDDSRGLAIRITYRISLRSSSLWEPRHPLLKVVMSLGFRGRPQ
jgi:hypothetical protein